MKKNIKKITGFLFLMTVFTCAMVTNTLAKYTNSIAGSQSVKFAKWYVTIDDDAIDEMQSWDFTLFNTVYDSDGETMETFNTMDSVIAPGTSGEYQFNIHNRSDVDCSYDIDFTLTQKSVSGFSNIPMCPIEFKIDDSQWSRNPSIDAATIASGSNETHTIKWRWLYDSDNDESDTFLGSLMQLDSIPSDFLTVTLEATFTQND